MKNNEASLFVFIASIIIGILISLNINFNKTYNRVFLSTKQYQDAYNEKTRLRNDISKMLDEYEEMEKKLYKYEYGNDNQAVMLQELYSELDKNKMLIGKFDVEGEGITIKLTDGSNNFDPESGENILDKIIHNYDITNVINDLRSAGAEAISINGQRVIDTTEVYCDGPLLRVNGVKIAAPFYINAIGNKEVLKSYMLAEENYINLVLLYRGINVELREENSIKIQAYSNSTAKKFLTLADKDKN